MPIEAAKQNSRRKILFVITKSNFGGAQRYVYELATTLPKDAFDVAVACGGGGTLIPKLTEAGIRIYIIKSFERDINILKEVRAFVELREIIRAERPDIVHLNSSKAGGTGALAARLEGISKIVFTAHGWPFFENRNILWKSTIWALSWLTTLLSHTVIAVSVYDKKRARMWNVKKKISVIHTAVPPIAFHSRNDARAFLIPSHIEARHKDDFWLTTIAEHTTNKNILTALEAVARHNAQHPKKIFYTLIGEGELTQSLQEYVQTHTLEDFVYFAGYIDDARTYLNAFDGFLLPSLKEGFPYALLEAGLAGVPCIASNVGGIFELITNMETGLTVSPRDVSTITTALSYVVAHPEEISHYAEKLRMKIHSEYTLETMIEETIRIYTT